MSRHETPTRKRVRNKMPSSTRRERSAREKVEIREGEDRENGLSPEGSASKPRPRTLENQAQEGLNRLKSVINESLHHVSSRDSGNPAIKAM